MLGGREREGEREREWRGKEGGREEKGDKETEAGRSRKRDQEAPARRRRKPCCLMTSLFFSASLEAQLAALP